MCPDVLGTADEGDVDEVLLIAYVSECGDQRLVKVVPLETKLLVASAPPHDPDTSVDGPIFDERFTVLFWIFAFLLSRPLNYHIMYK